MKTKDLIILFIIVLVNLTAGLTLLPFLSIFAMSYPGVNPGQTGIFLALVWSALTAGTVIGSRLAEKFQRRRLLVQISGVLSLLAFAPVGFTTELWQFGLLIGIGWFAAGVAMTMTRIIAGILAAESERGRVFGVIGAAGPLAALISGFIGGPIVDRWGMKTLFVMLSLVFLIEIITARFIQDVKVQPAENAASGGGQPLQVGPGYWFLMAATVVSFAGMAEMLMGRPLQMEALGFNSTAISGVFIGGGLIGLPVTLLAGWLADRIGRKNLVMAGLLIAIPGMAVLINAEPLWHFWLSEIFLTFVTISNAIGAALVADLVRKESLDKAMGYFSAASFIGSVIGFIFTGYLIDSIGLSALFVIATGLMVVAFLFTLPIPGSVRLEG